MTLHEWFKVGFYAGGCTPPAVGGVCGLSAPSGFKALGLENSWSLGLVVDEAPVLFASQNPSLVAPISETLCSASIASEMST